MSRGMVRGGGVWVCAILLFALTHRLDPGSSTPPIPYRLPGCTWYQGQDHPEEIRCLSSRTAGWEPLSVGARLALGLSVNLNDVTARDLSDLPGLGLKLATRIIESRRLLGPFPEVEDLRRVSGVGPITLKELGQFLSTSSNR